MDLQGKTIVNDEVFIELARTAMTKVNAVFREDRKGTFAELSQLFADKFVPQVAVKKTPTEDGDATSFGTATFELKLALTYGVNIPDAVQKVRDTVKSEVETYTGYTVDRIDVIVDRLVKPEKVETE